MAQNSHQSQNDRRLKQINADARHSASERGKKEHEESEKRVIQMKL
jgi:hypothetical protein